MSVLYLEFESTDRANRVQKLSRSGAHIVVTEPRWPGFFEVAKKEKPYAIAIDFSQAPSHALETADYIAKAKETRDAKLYLLRVPKDRSDIVRRRLPQAPVVTESELIGLLAVAEKEAVARAREKKEAASQARKAARARKAEEARPAGAPPPKAKTPPKAKRPVEKSRAKAKKKKAAPPKKKPPRKRRPRARVARGPRRSSRAEQGDVMAQGFSKEALSGYARERRGEYEDILGRMVEIPTVSVEPERKAEVARGAEYAVSLLEKFGAKAELHQTKGHPHRLRPFRPQARTARRSPSTTTSTSSRLKVPTGTRPPSTSSRRGIATSAAARPTTRGPR